MTEVEEIRALSTAELLRRLASYTKWMGLPHTQPRLLSAEASRRAETMSDADRVCHDDQMAVWSGDVIGRLAMGDYLRADFDYDDTLALHSAVADEIRSIVESALSHPELAASLSPQQPTDTGDLDRPVALSTSPNK
ncbi:hypothetical protein [Methylobacterium thuringiense]|uniref:Uncharacterized protein n=1 Tax=Methylobacterium thuringiense TaxID=1003091 RepID=A0ABQ4TGV1_9HYPH|nr:hypothetical protein [Methylobacterium thuringiense]GJE54526.1 hypothetical protein EKPJFOCH_1004 [Methylobacterium thuringiense]